MSHVIGVHQLDLKPGVSAEEFEQFAREQVVPAFKDVPGLTATVYAGERGARAGGYLLVMAFESAAARDRMFPASDVYSEDTQRWYDSHAAMWQRWDQLTSMPGGPSFTDYVEVAG